MNIKNKITNIILILLLSSVSGLAADLKLDKNGNLHKIEVIHLDGSSDESPKTYLLHTLQKNNGAIKNHTIPLTNDSLPDIEPQFDINPCTQQLCLVWSRFDGIDYELAFSSFNGIQWLNPIILTSNSIDDRESRIVIGNSGAVHLMWKEDTPGLPTYFHVNINSGLEEFITPEFFSPPQENLVLPDGTTPASSIFPENQNIFFAFYIPISPKRIAVWGGRDDPSPINFQEGFLLLDDFLDVEKVKVKKVKGKLLVTFKADNKLCYTYRTAEGWTPYRIINLDQDLSEAKAEILIKEMLAAF